MKTIKFRAFGKNSKEFLTDGKTIGWTLKQIQNIEDIDAWEMSQYTGLKDKNGKEIYEGDIIRNNWTNQVEEISDISSIAWLISDGFLAGQGDEKLLDAEVIGNIYENPNLLN